MTTRVQISFINAPKPGKTNGTIKTKDDQLYGVKPDMLGFFEQKKTYDIEFSSREFNGQTYKTVTSVKKVEDAPATAAAANGAGTSYGKYGATDNKTAERIFVCGALNAVLGNGAMLIEEINTERMTNLVNIFRLVWDDTFGKDGKPVKNADMGGDEIPY